jgi:hypothetical protein
MVRDPVQQILLSLLLSTCKHFPLQVCAIHDEVAVILEVRSRQKNCAASVAGSLHLIRRFNNAGSSS